MGVTPEFPSLDEIERINGAESDDGTDTGGAEDQRWWDEQKGWHNHRVSKRSQHDQR